MMNEITILLSKERKLWVRGCKIDNTNPTPIKLIGLLAQSGFILSDKFQGIITQESEKILLKILGQYLKETRGLGRRWKTVWLTPNNLPESTELQKLIQVGLYSNPELLKGIRESQKNIPEFWEVNGWNPDTILEPGYDSDISSIFENLLSSPLPLSSEDIEIVSWIMENRKDLVKIPSQILVKETLSIALSYGYGKECISGVTDILRVASYLSGSSSILTKETRLKLSRKDRRLVLELLEEYIDKKGLNFCAQDAKKYKELWKILSRICHPTPKYPKSYKFFGEIQSNSEMMRKGWNSNLQKAYNEKNYEEVLRLLFQRPSEFIRRYDSLFRKAYEENDTNRIEKIQSSFIGIQGVPDKVLFELYRYYDKRGEEIQRSFLDKKGIRRLYSPLPSLPKDFLELSQVIIMNVIRENWKKKDTFKGKKVYLNLPEGINFQISNRNGVMDKTEPMYPGQKIYFPTSGMIRFFSQWIDPDGTEDLDLHAWLVTESLKMSKQISWDKDFSDEDKVITHSGDVRHQKGDCAEYVTIDYSKEVPYSWMLVTVQNYEGRKLCDLENWIGISQVSGENQTTLFRGKVTSEAKDMAAFIINIKEGWIRLILEGIGEDVLNNEELIKQYITPTLDVKELLSQYVECTGGEISESPSDETIILQEEDIMSGKIYEYLLG